MEIVDVRGLSCPIPVIRTKKVMDRGVKELLVIGESNVSRENVSKLANSAGYTVTMKVDDRDSWEMELRK